MNWKKEGYKKDQKVFLVSKGMFTRDIHYYEGVIIHAGTKILKVKIDASERILEFKNSTYTSGALWGYGYYLYKSEEVYKNEIIETTYKNELLEKVKNSLSKLTNEQLEEIIKWTEEEG